jgi:hypothetical protein
MCSTTRATDSTDPKKIAELTRQSTARIGELIVGDAKLSHVYLKTIQKREVSVEVGTLL